MSMRRFEIIQNVYELNNKIVDVILSISVQERDSNFEQVLMF